MKQSRESGLVEVNMRSKKPLETKSGPHSPIFRRCRAQAWGLGYNDKQREQDCVVGLDEPCW